MKQPCQPIIGLILRQPGSGKAGGDERCRSEAKKQGAVLGYGQFLTIAINFVIIAWVLFLAVRAINRLYAQPAPKPAEPPADVKLLTEIRDLLAKRTGSPGA